MPEPKTTKLVQIALFDGFELLDAFAPLDVWQLANKLSPGLRTELVSVSGAEEITALGGVPIRPTAGFVADGDVLLVPGAPEMWRSGEMPPGLAQTMHAWLGEGRLLATVCTGAVFAARAGLLRGRPAITHRSALSVLSEEGARVTHARVVDAGDLITCGGVTSGLDLAIYLAERFLGSDIAMRVEDMMEYERRGTVWRDA